jgi:hypothetical protein
MSTYRLRPHHGLCIAFFEGKGYSPEFIDTMTTVIGTLQETSCVQLTTGEDILCADCPNNCEHICVHDNKVGRYDENVLAACHLNTGEVLSWRDFSNLIHTHILLVDKLHTICGDCEWGVICQSKADRISKNQGMP